MKTVKRAVVLHNIDDPYDQLHVGDHFFNFIRDIEHYEYEVIDIKYLFYSIDDDNTRYGEVEVSYDDYDDVDGFLYPTAAINMVNWLSSHHFDYYGLIEKGLALEAPEGMYKNE